MSVDDGDLSPAQLHEICVQHEEDDASVNMDVLMKNSKIITGLRTKPFMTQWIPWQQLESQYCHRKFLFLFFVLII